MDRNKGCILNPTSYSSRLSMLAIGLTLHIAFEVAAINDPLDAPKRLKDQGSSIIILSHRVYGA